jgi:DNA-directed RNA polymerase specialized sigma subunit
MNLQRVLDQLNPVIQRAVNRWSGTLARPALELEAKTLAREAIGTYRPGAGASLATHVTNRLQKLSRLNYQHQNLARIPEYQNLKYNTYQRAQAQLQDELGRDPTNEELADQLGWSRPAVTHFQRNLRQEFIESGDTPPIFDDSPGESGMVDYIYYDLSPIQQKIFEFTSGYQGAPRLSNPEIMKKLNLTQGQLSYQKRLMINRIENIKSGRKW